MVRKKCLKSVIEVNKENIRTGTRENKIVSSLKKINIKINFFIKYQKEHPYKLSTNQLGTFIETIIYPTMANIYEEIRKIKNDSLSFHPN